MVLIYTGDGKGKTTAAAGSALRMAGSGRSVLFTQFLKDGTSGECRALENIKEVNLLLPEKCFGFTFQMDQDMKKTAQEFYADYWEYIKEVAEAGGYAMVILDEIIGAVSTGMVDEDSVLCFLKEHKSDTEIILTGRDPSKELLLLGDYITDMKNLRHPYDSGIPAREGVEK